MLIDLIKKTLSPKSINDVRFNGKRLSDYIVSITKLINNDEVICLYDPLVSIIQLEAEKLLQDAKKLYQSEMSKYMVENKLQIKKYEMFLKFEKNLYNKNLSLIEAGLIEVNQLKNESKQMCSELK